ncbi:MAG: hypothetical protein M3Y08_13625 [Fibrobacterota bacterium]|nr:hypothetical protein [Fibrobacterota bacterium]
MKILARFFVLLILTGAARADERMNGMVGLWYGPYNGFSFEYDLIAQFWKSKEWMGTITGPYISEEIGTKSNRYGIGFVAGRRVDEKGTFAGSVTLFNENRWERFSKTETGAEAKLSLFVVGMKLGLIEDWKKLYWQVGLSY